MPLIARTPREAFHTSQDHLNRTLNKILTHYRLEFTVRHVKQERTFLHFRDNNKQATAVPLPPSPWYLYLGQELQAVPSGNEYTPRILQYAYRIQRTPSIQDEAEVRFEYVSREIEPSARYPRHHVQFHREYQNVRDGFSPNELHIPTGGVSVEDVIRFLIADLGVPPLIETWDEELREEQRKVASIGGAVFTRNGRPIRNYRTAFEEAREKTGLKDVTPHDYRHTAITRWLLAGIPQEVVMKVSGHKDLSVHYRYVNLREEHVTALFSAAPLSNSWQTGLTGERAVG